MVLHIAIKNEKVFSKVSSKDMIYHFLYSLMWNEYFSVHKFIDWGTYICISHNQQIICIMFGNLVSFY